MVSKTYFIIATNGYHEFAIRLLKGLDWRKIRRSVSKFIVLTDEQAEFDILLEDSDISGHLTVCEIPSHRWPYATLLRYSLMLEHFDLVETPYVGYLDADMVVVNSAQFLGLPEDREQHKLFLTAHPGYFQASKLRRLAFTFGPWCIYEKRRTSIAYVRFSRRQSEYVCGGHWFGEVTEIRKLLTSLSESVDRDLDNGMVAIHHDESHLNSYRQSVAYYLLDPRWAYASGHGTFVSDDPIVEVVDKDPEWFSKRKPSK